MACGANRIYGSKDKVSGVWFLNFSVLILTLREGDLATYTHTRHTSISTSSQVTTVLLLASTHPLLSWLSISCSYFSFPLLSITATIITVCFTSTSSTFHSIILPLLYSLSHYLLPLTLPLLHLSSHPTHHCHYLLSTPVSSPIFLHPTFLPLLNYPVSLTTSYPPIRSLGITESLGYSWHGGHRHITGLPGWLSILLNGV